MSHKPVFFSHRLSLSYPERMWQRNGPKTLRSTLSVVIEKNKGERNKRYAHFRALFWWSLIAWTRFHWQCYRHRQSWRLTADAPRSPLRNEREEKKRESLTRQGDCVTAVFEARPHPRLNLIEIFSPLYFA
jgi:hypothetical protein